jgi:hypothetical protein
MTMMTTMIVTAILCFCERQYCAFVRERIEVNLFPSPHVEDMNANESTSLCNTTNKAVRWYPRCKVRFFIGIPDEEEKINAWYLQDNIQSFKEERE